MAKTVVQLSCGCARSAQVFWSNMSLVLSYYKPGIVPAHGGQNTHRSSDICEVISPV